MKADNHFNERDRILGCQSTTTQVVNMKDECSKLNIEKKKEKRNQMCINF